MAIGGLDDFTEQHRSAEQQLWAKSGSRNRNVRRGVRNVNKQTFVHEHCQRQLSASSRARGRHSAEHLCSSKSGHHSRQRHRPHPVESGPFMNGAVGWERKLGVAVRV